MREAFRKELEASGYVHSPLPLHQERSLEAEREKKEVKDRRKIWDGTQKMPELLGIGALSLQENKGQDGGSVLHVTLPTARNRDVYEGGVSRSRFQSHLTFQFPRENWEAYNRIAFRAKPDCMGSHSVHFRLHIRNEGIHPIPDAYFREGQHLINLVNHEWNDVIWEFEALPRDCITSFSVVIDADGQDTSTGTELAFDFENFALQKVEKAEKEKGWACEEAHISYSMSGYQIQGKKTAVANRGADTFAVLDEAGNTVLCKAAEQRTDRFGSFAILDFSELKTPGFYRLKLGALTTEVFEIGEKVLEDAVWKAINFIFCERCGYPVPGKHGRCHTDVIAEHNGCILSFGGGWHDAGDMSQQMLQTAEVAQEILELASRVKDDPLLYHRLMEEGLWGLEFTLKSRFGDGYRASSVGLGVWTDGLIGNTDDVKTRVHNQAFQNFFCAAVEAQAGLAFREFDPDLAWKCVEVAKEDFRFAKQRFLEKGMELPNMWEHTLNSGFSQYCAAAVWAAASICAYAADAEFEQEAKAFGSKLLACQETGTEGIPLRGFFYRDETHRTIVHFTHQGRDHSFVQALEMLCRAFPEAVEKPEWENGMRLYGEYVSKLYEMASPYGMLPAGIHHISEVEDAETFPLLHLLVEHETEKANYEQQLKAGIDLGNGYYVRMFPVWFSFRGNAAIMLAMGKAAGILGRYFGDETLLEIAREQLYWMSGKNPFCQSLIYGEGSRYAQQDANYPGEMTGEMPVGIETRDNEDEPYWPAGNNATYKEVWLTPAGRWLSVVAELYPQI